MPALAPFQNLGAIALVQWVKKSAKVEMNYEKCVEPTMFDIKLKNGETIRIPEDQFHEFLEQYGEQVERHKVELRRQRVKTAVPPTNTR